MGHHLKRVEPYGKRRPWHTLSAMPATHAHNGWSDASVRASAMPGLVMALQVTLPSPG